MKTVFLDRDGVINVRPIDDWVKCWEEFHFLDGVPEALKLLKDEGFRLVLITNQRCLALGLITRQQLDDIHALMNQYLVENGSAAFDDIYVCPHDRHEGCECRKPKPGMILQAQSKHMDFSVDDCVMFGDRESDRGAAEAAGCKEFYQINAENSLLDKVREYLTTL